MKCFLRRKRQRKLLQQLRFVVFFFDVGAVCGGCHYSSPVCPVSEEKWKQTEEPTLLIDTRTAEEYTAGHVQGVLLMPYDTIGDTIEGGGP